MYLKYYLKKEIVIAIVLLIFASAINAQEKKLVGKVTMLDSIPLVGVRISVSSTNEVVYTDTTGVFQVNCREKDKINVEAGGFYPKKIKIEKEIRLVLVNLTLKKGDKNLNMAEKYVQVGYGYVNSRKLLYSVSTANQNDIDFTKYVDLYDAIQGLFPGVSVENGNIVVRGVKTFYGIEGNAALIVIDGAISTANDLTNLSVYDVQSIDVLKDGSASIYGGRGANGVVIVQTKKGQQ